MSAEKSNGGSTLLQSIVSGIVLTALTGIIVAETKNSDKLSDIRASMMPREEVELKIHQLSVELRSLEASFQSDKRAWEQRAQITDIEIAKIRYQLESTVRTTRP